MTSFADLLSEDAAPEPAAPQRKGRSFLDVLDKPQTKPKRQLSTRSQVVNTDEAEPTFDTRDPVAMRQKIAATGDRALLASFDQQFPSASSRPENAGGGRGSASVSDYWQGAGINKSSGTQKQARLAHSGGKVDPLFDVVANQASGLASTVAGGLHGIAKLVTTGDINQAADAVRSTQEAGTWQPRTEQGRAVADVMSSKYNPLNYSGVAGDYVGGKLADAGMPGVGAAVNTVITTAPMLLGSKTVREPIKNFLGNALPTKTVAPPIAARVEPAMEARPAASPTVAAPSGSPGVVAAAEAPMEMGQYRGQPLRSVGAAEVVNPRANEPTLSFREKPEFARGGESLPNEAQARRVQVLQDVGLSEARKSAITGNGMSAADDYQSSKVNNQAGAMLKAQLDTEKQALSDYSDKIISQAGGTRGLDQSATYARGSSIVSPLEAYREWFDTRTRELYAEADRRAQGTPASLSSFASELQDASHMTNSDKVHLRDAAMAYAKKLGMVDEQGNISGNAKQAETLRKYLNENWSPSNSRYVGALKEAIDSDVMKSAGDDIYGSSRDLWKQRQNTLENPKGIAALIDVDPNGINRSVAMEKIPDKLMGMPYDQFQHVIQTLRGAPPELQPQAQAALAEIKAHFANQVQATGLAHAGQWNAKGVSQLLNRHSQRMLYMLSPEEQQAYATLNEAGHILSKDQSYPGAAIQTHNLLRSGVIQGIQGLSTAAGSAIGGPIGAAVGSAVGGKMGAKVGEAASIKAAKARTVDLTNGNSGSVPIRKFLKVDEP